MVPALMWVSVHCDQCADPPAAPGGAVVYPDENAALEAAMTAGWVVAADGRLLCSACGPVLVCEADGHDFIGWHRPQPAAGALPRTCRCAPGRVVHLLGSPDCGRVFRYCRRCCLHESATAPAVVGVA